MFAAGWRPFRARRLVAGPSLALLLASCTGGNAGSDTLETQDPEARSFIEQANAACGGVAGEVAGIVGETYREPEPGRGPDPAELRSAAGRVTSTVRSALDRVRAVTPPRADTKVIARMLREFDSGLERLRADPALLAAIGTGKGGDPFRAADRLALGYGVTRCALSSAEEGGD